MADKDLVPLSDEQAKAVQESAKFLTKALGTVDAAGDYVRDVLGGLPHNLVGILGDAVWHLRLRNFARMWPRTKKLLEERGVSSEPITLTLATPLLEAASNEDRPELQDMWVRLIAAAMDPDRRGRVRLAFISTVKELDPLDARVLEAIWKSGQDVSAMSKKNLEASFKVTLDEIEVSCDNLTRLGCIKQNPSTIRAGTSVLSSFGRALMRACHV